MNKNVEFVATRGNIAFDIFVFEPILKIPFFFILIILIISVASVEVCNGLKKIFLNVLIFIFFFTLDTIQSLKVILFFILDDPIKFTLKIVEFVFIANFSPFNFDKP